MGSILPTIADVSSWQGDIAWGTTKGNLHFAILRVQDGTYLDPKLSRNVQSCESLGIPYYVYGFYRNGGAIEAARMVSRAKAAGASNVRGYILDVEVTGQSISGIKSAMATLNETGLDNGMYIANHLYGEYGGTDYGEKWRWIPTYGPNDGYAHTPPSHACELWQFTSEGRVPGVDGGVDGGGLRQDIVAVGIFFKHPLDAANLSFDSAQTVRQLLSLILGTGCGLAVAAASGFFLFNIFFRFFTFFCTHLTYFVICFYRFILSCRILFFQLITSFIFHIPTGSIFTIYPL